MFYYRCLGLLGGILAMVTAINQVEAAQVPPNVQLAEQQQLVINNGAEVQSLDPHKTAGMSEANIIRDLLEGLVSFGIDGQVVPGVARRWQASADYRQWTFYLRTDAKWSNGDSVTARDFVYSWRRLANSATKSPNASYLSDMQLLNSAAVIRGEQPLSALGIEAVDDHILQLQLAQPVPFLVEMLADSSLYPLHQPTVEQYGNGVDDNKWYAVPHFVGNGAYRLQEWVVNEKIVLTRSPSYWDNANTVIERVTYLTIADEVVDIRRYQAGEIDISHYLFPPERYVALQKQLPNELRQLPSYSVYGYRFNLLRAPFNDRRVRQALALVVDRETIVNTYLVQGERAAYTLNPPTMKDFQPRLPEWTNWTLAQRVAEAKRLLQEAGYHAKNPLRFSLLYNISELHEQLALAVSEFWKQTLGAEVTLEQQEWKVYLLNCREGNYQAARFGFRAVYPHPSAMLNLLRASSSSNHCFYKSQWFDQQLQQALTASTASERQHCYQQAELQLAEDVPLLPLFHSTRSALVKPYVGGLERGAVPAQIYTKDLYLIQHKQLPSRYRQ